MKTPKWLEEYWPIPVVIALMFGLMITLVITSTIEHQQRESAIQAFSTKTGLPIKNVQIDSPVYTIIAQNQTEFENAIHQYNATTIYRSGYTLYVFRNDYVEATSWNP